MSVLFDLEDENGNVDDSKLPLIIARYDKYLETAEDDLRIEGKTLERANLEQASLLSFYDEKRIELYSLKKYYEAQVQRTKGFLWRDFTENFNIALSPTDKGHYIAKEDKYLDKYQLYLLVVEMYNKYESLVEAFKARGFALRNITNVRVAALEDVVL